MWDDDLLGGPRNNLQRSSVRNRFSALATRAGIATGGTVETGYATWLCLLRVKLQPENKEYFSTTHHVSEISPPIERKGIPLSQIDPPADGELKVFSEADVAEFVESIKKHGLRRLLVVEPSSGDRYVTITDPEQCLIHAACVALNRATVQCGVREPGAAPKRIKRDYVAINHICLASAELCELLETEAFAREQAADQRVTKIRQESAQARPSGAEYVFRHDSEGWHISYGGEEWSGKSHVAGLSLI